jgi:hypothetical protein
MVTCTFKFIIFAIIYSANAIADFANLAANLECNDEQNQKEFEITLDPIKFKDYVSKEVFLCTMGQLKTRTSECPKFVKELFPKSHQARPGYILILMGESNDNSVLYFLDNKYFSNDDIGLTHAINASISYLNHHGITFESTIESKLYLFDLMVNHYEPSSQGMLYTGASFRLVDIEQNNVYPVLPITQNEFKVSMDNYAINKLFTWKFGVQFNQLIPLEKTEIVKSQDWWHEINDLYRFHYAESPGESMVKDDRIPGIHSIVAPADEVVTTEQKQVAIESRFGLQHNFELQDQENECRIRFGTEVITKLHIGKKSQLSLGNASEIAFSTSWLTFLIGNEFSVMGPSPNPNDDRFISQGKYWVGFSAGKNIGFSLKYSQNYTSELPFLYAYAYDGPSTRREGIVNMSLYFRLGIKKKKN